MFILLLLSLIFLIYYLNFHLNIIHEICIMQLDQFKFNSEYNPINLNLTQLTKI